MGTVTMNWWQWILFIATCIAKYLPTLWNTAKSIKDDVDLLSAKNYAVKGRELTPEEKATVADARITKAWVAARGEVPTAYQVALLRERAWRAKEGRFAVRKEDAHIPDVVLEAVA